MLITMKKLKFFLTLIEVLGSALALKLFHAVYMKAISPLIKIKNWRNNFSHWKAF